MLKLGLLFPEAEMTVWAEAFLQERQEEVVFCRAIDTTNTVNEGRAAVEAGAQVLVARGYQAKILQEFLEVPIAEIILTTQEIGLLLKQAVRMTGKQHPSVAILAFDNMLPDMSHMEELFDVSLQIYYMDGPQDVPDLLTAMEGRKERPDLVIGGHLACHLAEERGYMTLFYDSTEESVRKGMELGISMLAAMEQESQNQAHLETILDTSFNAMMRVNDDHQIFAVNGQMEEILGKKREALVGKTLTEVLPQVDMEMVDNVISGESENYTVSVNIRGRSWMLLMAPIEYKTKITGVILSFHLVTDETEPGAVEQTRIRMNAFATNVTFKDFHTSDPTWKNTLEQAEAFALSPRPILIYAPPGTEGMMLARAIHTNSRHSAGPFVSVNVRGMNEDQQMDTLFREADETAALSSEGAVRKAHHGTLFIRGVEDLSLPAQHQLLRLLLPWRDLRSDVEPVRTVDIRLIVSSKRNLRFLVEDGSFSEELYYLINGLTLTVPPFNRRKDDLGLRFQESLRKYSRRYNRRLHVTDGGMQRVLSLEWPGNDLQLEAFCERLTLSVNKRQIDEVIIQKLYDELYPKLALVDREERLVVYDDPEGVKLRELLEQYHGNRVQVAEALGISTTTLWRRMKKYGIEARYGK